jgi:hypothetical protein
MTESATSSPEGRSLLAGVDLAAYYGPQSATDQAIAALCAAFRDVSPEGRGAFAHGLDAHDRRVLGRYALRAPMLALRSRNVDHLRTGLLAHVLLRQRVPDWRDDLVAYAPYYHTARALGLAPQSLFDEAAAYAVPELAGVMRTFGRRADVTLPAFGWRRIETPDGPTFEMMGLRNAPTGAVIGDPSWDHVNEAEAAKLKAWLASQRTRGEQGKA